MGSGGNIGNSISTAATVKSGKNGEISKRDIKAIISGSGLVNSVRSTHSRLNNTISTPNTTVAAKEKKRHFPGFSIDHDRITTGSPLNIATSFLSG